MTFPDLSLIESQSFWINGSWIGIIIDPINNTFRMGGSYKRIDSVRESIYYEINQN